MIPNHVVPDSFTKPMQKNSKELMRSASGLRWFYRKQILSPGQASKM